MISIGIFFNLGDASPFLSVFSVHLLGKKSRENYIIQQSAPAPCENVEIKLSRGNNHLLCDLSKPSLCFY